MTAPAPTVDDVIYAIRAYVHSQGWTSYRLAKKARIGPTTLRDFHTARWVPNTTTLRVLRSLIPDDFDPATAPPPPPLLGTEHGKRPEENGNAHG